MTVVCNQLVGFSLHRSIKGSLKWSQEPYSSVSTPLKSAHYRRVVIFTLEVLLSTPQGWMRYTDVALREWPAVFQCSITVKETLLNCQTRGLHSSENSTEHSNNLQNQTSSHENSEVDRTACGMRNGAETRLMLRTAISHDHLMNTHMQNRAWWLSFPECWPSCVFPTPAEAWLTSAIETPGLCETPRDNRTTRLTGLWKL